MDLCQFLVKICNRDEMVHKQLGHGQDNKLRNGVRSIPVWVMDIHGYITFHIFPHAQVCQALVAKAGAGDSAKEVKMPNAVLRSGSA